MKKYENIKFEEALHALEGIVEQLEKGDTSLEESLKFYKEGVVLSNICTKQLEDAEQQVMILQEHRDGEFDLKAFSKKEDAK